MLKFNCEDGKVAGRSMRPERAAALEKTLPGATCTLKNKKGEPRYYKRKGYKVHAKEAESAMSRKERREKKTEDLYKLIDTPGLRKAARNNLERRINRLEDKIAVDERILMAIKDRLKSGTEDTKKSAAGKAVPADLDKINLVADVQKKDEKAVSKAGEEDAGLSWAEKERKKLKAVQEEYNKNKVSEPVEKAKTLRRLYTELSEKNGYVLVSFDAIYPLLVKEHPEFQNKTMFKSFLNDLCNNAVIDLSPVNNRGQIKDPSLSMPAKLGDLYYLVWR